ncbi:peptidyl-prolyl cis-trans isomerase [Yoonia sediminilitoris]|uniref:Peptidyl-prolyl cis-trans isomerase D n=1 Tax=Yoonia sediminilitoris TaxID=1286148 RepID=A0A2T6KRW1_9RHOB|nr:peptidyl-prolyl cis-trans isomerase [Yoonia sediminilitoris]PUB19303.1 peptidyl-prolyl cis-trans isomerase D [Yoonia sediminilitoris]RCW99471.1 peptidyl-prolyl cis-trans isomerase D [Yoonia sediminilitoris]
MAKKQGKRYGLWFIVILLLVGLAGFGTNGFSGNVRSIGTVGDKEISVTAYQRTLQNQIRMLSQQFGTPISMQQAQAFGLDQAALQQVILTRTLDNEASALGISVGDETVLDRLRQIPDFQGGSGFNRETYRLALQQSGQSEAEFETTLREDVARNLLQAAIVGGVPTADAYADNLIQYIGEQRSVTWAAVGPEALTTAIPAPTDAELQAYYDANPDDFTLPESRDITYAWLTPDMIQDQMNVNDAAIEQLYNDRISEFVQPERRLVERLVYLDQAQADAAIASLNAGEATFEDLVVARGLSLSDIDLGDVSRDELGAAGDAVFAARSGDVVGPFDAGLGQALFRMNAVLAASETPLEDAADDLREELAANAARDVINDGVDQVIDLLAGGARLEDLAERTDMQLGTIAWTDARTDGIAAYEAFRNAAASVSEGEFPEVIDLADGGIFALRVDGVTPPAVQPLEDVRAEVIAGWQDQARQEAVIALADGIAASILPLTGFDTLGLTPTVEESLTRRSFVAGAPADFNDTIFEMAVGDVRVLPGDDGAVIVRLDAIAPPDMADETNVAQKAQLAQDASQGIAQNIFEAYAASLQAQTELNINQATVNAVNAQFQ